MTRVCIQRTRAATAVTLPYIDELQTSINVADKVITGTIFFKAYPSLFTTAYASVKTVSTEPPCPTCMFDRYLVNLLACHTYRGGNHLKKLSNRTRIVPIWNANHECPHSPCCRGISFKAFLRILATLKSKVFWPVARNNRYLCAVRANLGGSGQYANTDSDYFRKPYRTHHFLETPGGGGLPSTR